MEFKRTITDTQLREIISQGWKDYYAGKDIGMKRADLAEHVINNFRKL